MNDSKAIQEERLNELKKLIKEEFPSGKFEINFDPIISVSFSAPQNGNIRIPRISFNYSEELMTDIDSQIDEVFSQGIQIAKKVLDTPPFVNHNFQGEIFLDHGGAVFNKRQI